jgi:hypothetical protein
MALPDSSRWFYVSGQDGPTLEFGLFLAESSR